MSIEFINPEFEVVRDMTRCTNCGLCEKQCANGVHKFNSVTKKLESDETKCVNC